MKLRRQLSTFSMMSLGLVMLSSFAVPSFAQGGEVALSRRIATSTKQPRKNASTAGCNLWPTMWSCFAPNRSSARKPRAQSRNQSGMIRRTP